MPVYRIKETRPAVLCWDYTVIADNEDEAIRKVHDGEVEHEDHWTDDDPWAKSHYDVVEED